MYAFWLPLCYLLAIVSSILLQCMSSDYPFVICWPLYRLSYFNVYLLITTLVSVGHCIVCPTSMYAFWLPLWYLLAIVSSVLLCPTSMYAFWLPHWYLLAIVSSVLLRFMPSGYHIGICWPLYCLSYFDLCLLITTLVSVGHCIVCPTSMYAFWLPLWYLLAIVSSVLLQCMPSDYHIGICWPLHRLSYFDLCLLITTLLSFGHCIISPTSIYAFWLSHWYLLAIVLSVLLRFMPSDYHIGICWPMLSDYPFGIFWPLYRLSYFDLCLLITTLVYVGHFIICPTSIYAFWLPLWYLLAIVSYVLLRFMPSDYPFDILWPLYRLSYFDLCLLITPLVSFSHCIVFPTSIYAFWLPLWYLLAIVSSVLLRITASDYPFGIFWPLYRLSYFDLWLLINPLVSSDFSIYVISASHHQGFWIWFPFMQGVLDTTLSDAVCQYLDSRPRMVFF
jgi:hypothetical protein